MHVGRRIAHGHGIQTVFFQQGHEGGPIDGHAAGRQGRHVQHGQVVLEKVGHASRHVAQGGVECLRIGAMQNGGDSNDGGNLDFDRLLRRAFGHKHLSK
ncbi:hypothetical protein D9M68_963310 [compost metagenome]